MICRVEGGEKQSWKGLAISAQMFPEKAPGNLTAVSSELVRRQKMLDMGLKPE